MGVVAVFEDDDDFVSNLKIEQLTYDTKLINKL